LKFQLAAPAEPKIWRRAAHRSTTARRISIYQSGTFNNLGAMAPMFDNLIRAIRATAAKPSSLISRIAGRFRRTADLHLLPQGVLFSDGVELTADDVKATFDRPGIRRKVSVSREASCSSRSTR
jgi:hypothetical protein